MNIHHMDVNPCRNPHQDIPRRKYKRLEELNGKSEGMNPAHAVQGKNTRSAVEGNFLGNFFLEF